jgi:hypothetical protein
MIIGSPECHRTLVCLWISVIILVRNVSNRILLDIKAVK